MPLGRGRASDPTLAITLAMTEAMGVDTAAASDLAEEVRLLTQADQAAQLRRLYLQTAASVPRF